MPQSEAQECAIRYRMRKNGPLPGTRMVLRRLDKPTAIRCVRSHGRRGSARPPSAGDLDNLGHSGGVQATKVSTRLDIFEVCHSRAIITWQRVEDHKSVIVARKWPCRAYRAVKSPYRGE
jgi:hypothetical protein